MKIDQCRNACWATSEGTYVSWEYPHDDDITPDQDSYLRGWWDDFEAVMASNSATDPKSGYPTWIDVDSFADHILINELAHNVDAYRLSAYLYKDSDEDGGLLSFGPVWDFDRAFGNVTYCDCEKTSGLTIDDLHTCGYAYEYPFWYGVLLHDRWRTASEVPLGRARPACSTTRRSTPCSTTSCRDRRTQPRDDALWRDRRAPRQGRGARRTGS